VEILTGTRLTLAFVDRAVRRAIPAKGRAEAMASVPGCPDRNFLGDGLSRQLKKSRLDSGLRT
jgi:hypothetical protein